MQHYMLLGIPLFYYFLPLIFLISRIPVIGSFFKVINTALHEFGHAIMALILQGEVYRIELFGNSEGTTSTQSRGKLKAFLIAIAGYPFATAMSYFCFYLLSVGYEKQLIVGLSLLFFIMLLCWIRNGYGIGWTIFFCLLNALIIYFNDETVISIAALFYATVIFTESIFSTLVLLYLSLFKSNEAGDASNLAKLTSIPAFFWALLFVGQAAFVSYKVMLLVGAPSLF